MKDLSDFSYTYFTWGAGLVLNSRSGQKEKHPEMKSLKYVTILSFFETKVVDFVISAAELCSLLSLTDQFFNAFLPKF